MKHTLNYADIIISLYGPEHQLCRLKSHSLQAVSTLLAVTHTKCWRTRLRCWNHHPITLYFGSWKTTFKTVAIFACNIPEHIILIFFSNRIILFGGLENKRGNRKSNSLLFFFSKETCAIQNIPTNNKIYPQWNNTNISFLGIFWKV